MASNLVISDAHYGAALFCGGANSGTEIYLSDSWISAAALPATAYIGRTGECSGNFGFLTGMGGLLGGKTIPPSPSTLPWRNPHDGPVFLSTQFVNNVEFVNFNDQAISGCTQNFIVANNDMASDANANVLITNTKHTNNNQNNIAFFYPPDPASIGIDNCGGWACTGWSNTLIKDLDGTFFGLIQGFSSGGSAFGNLQNVGLHGDKCQFILAGSYYVCPGTDWGMLVWESQDVDNWTRLISPVNVTRPDGYRDDLNCAEDHAWDGFYTSMLRIQRFYGIVELQMNYTLLYRGTLPNDFKYQLQASTASQWVITRQFYTKPYIISVLVNGNPVAPIIPQNGVNITDTSVCGDNVYYPVEQIIEWKTTGAPDCIIDTIITNGLQGTVRYTMDPDQFWATNGPTSFVDNVALILGINPSSIRVVSVTKGSTIVVANIATPTQDPNANAQTQTQINNEINGYIKTLNTAIANGQLNLNNGAVVMDASFTPSVKNYNLTANAQPSPINSGSTIGIIAGCIAAAALSIGGFLMYRKWKKNKYLKKIQPVPEKYRKAEHTDLSNMGEKTQENMGLTTEKASPEKPIVGSVILEHE